ncbi:MAG: uracil-DNA glycosylase [Burkholderiales bacterium]|nr:uracil-DNA glycosylase [Burkholderiales bacterium]
MDRDERLREMGLAPVWRRRAQDPGPAGAAAEVATSAAGAPPVPAAVASSGAAAAGTTRELEIAALSWGQLAPHIAACTACELCRTRKRTVPGVGTATAGWMFVGEAPGAEEDALGEPFVGQAGRLLDNMLKAIGLSREKDVYIANVIKCRPPTNRNPAPAEVAQCAPYLQRQIALLQPKIIVALGRFAAMTLLNTDATIASLRGRVHTYRGAPLVVTYHPAYLLRTLPDKARAWEDLLLAKRAFADLQSPESSQP